MWINQSIPQASSERAAPRFRSVADKDRIRLGILTAAPQHRTVSAFVAIRNLLQRFAAAPRFPATIAAAATAAPGTLAGRHQRRPRAGGRRCRRPEPPRTPVRARGQNERVRKASCGAHALGHARNV
jgi:hypothetical protein